ncbi:MAG: hypothetical protein QQN63_09325 [Nitrosopumilus sp.]
MASLLTTRNLLIGAAVAALLAGGLFFKNRSVTEETVVPTVAVEIFVPSVELPDPNAE